VREKKTTDPVTRRLDALIRLFIEMNKPKGKEKFNEAVAVRLLKSMEFTPTEIARILGKKSASDVSQYLYSKKKTPKVNTGQASKPKDENTRDEVKDETAAEKSEAKT
jgi:predicted transcriptional regulator